MKNSIVAIAMLAAAQLGAQGIVRGSVMTEQGQRIVGVELQVPALKKTVYTDSAGEYKFVLPPGNYRITTRAIGFFSISDSIAPEANVELIQDFTLTSIAKLLDTVTTTAPVKKFMSAALNDFEARRKSGMGRYLTQEDFERFGNRQLSDIVRKLPGLYVRPGRGTAFFAASHRSASSRQINSACLVAVFLDGVPIYNGTGPPIDLNTFQARTLAGAEFYTSAATSPVQFKDRTGCGMLMLWTRER